MLLSVRDLFAGYGAIGIVNGVSFDLAAGETLAFLRSALNCALE